MLSVFVICVCYLYCSINGFIFIKAKFTMMMTTQIIKQNTKENENANEVEKPVGDQLEVRKPR